MSNDRLFSLIHEKLHAIASKQGVVLGPKNFYYALRGTEFTRRKDRWFSNSELIPYASAMPRSDFLKIRSALASCRGIDGEPCLSRDDLSALDRAYEAYAALILVHGKRPDKEQIHKRFYQLLTLHGQGSKRIEDENLLRDILSASVMTPFWMGNSRESRANRKAIRAALLSNASEFPSDSEKRLHFDDILLDIMSFCELLEGSRQGASSFRILATRQLKHQSLFRLYSLQQFMHFSDPSSKFAMLMLEQMLNSAPNSYSQAELRYVWIRAACSAIEQGFSLHDNIHGLAGHTIDYAFKKGLGMMGDETTQAVLNCEAYLVRAAALHGNLDSTLSSANDIRMKAEPGGLGPQLEGMLLISEAMAFLAASNKTDHGYLWACHSKLEALQRLNKEAQGMSTWPFDKKRVVELTAECRRALKLPD